MGGRPPSSAFTAPVAPECHGGRREEWRQRRGGRRHGGHVGHVGHDGPAAGSGRMEDAWRWRCSSSPTEIQLQTLLLRGRSPVSCGDIQCLRVRRGGGGDAALPPGGLLSCSDGAGLARGVRSDTWTPKQPLTCRRKERRVNL